MIKLLTCKIGETIINCFDGKYDKYTLKKWSEKKKLVCPDCGKQYEYCHGDIKSPYFRHKEKSKNCEGIYWEPETEEHIKGKMILYNWLLNMQNEGKISNLKLESYITSTKQRPDLYFEMNHEKYAIEFQCTPIASEFLERKELYRLAGINDIWILGLEKYNLEVTDDRISHSPYYKTIEQHSCIYLNIKNSLLYISRSLMKSFLPFNLIPLNEYYGFDISDFGISLKSKTVDIKNNIMYMNLVKLDNDVWLKLQKKQEIEKSLTLILDDIVISLNEFFKSKIDSSCDFYYKNGNDPYYIKAIVFNNSKSERTIFIKESNIDYCQKYSKSVVVGRGKRGGPRWGTRTAYRQIDSIVINSFDKNEMVYHITKFLINDFKSYGETYQNIQKELQRNAEFGEMLKDFLNIKITLINSSKQKIYNNIRFKYLRDFSITEEYMRNKFVDELKFLKRKKVTEYIFMIPKYNHHSNSMGFSKYIRVDKFNDEIIKYFKSFGFTNVNFLTESEVYT